MTYHVYIEGMDPEQVDAFEAYLDTPPEREGPSRHTDGVTFASLYGEVE